MKLRKRLRRAHARLMAADDFEARYYWLCQIIELDKARELYRG